MAEGMTGIVLAMISSGFLATLITTIINRHDKRQQDRDGMQAALRLILKDRLRFLCMHYISQTWIYEDELDDLIEMHKLYHDALHGNGYLDTLMSKVKALDVRGIGI